MNSDMMKRAQDASQKAQDRMLALLMGFDGCQKMTVGDIKFISEWTRTVAFDAITECQP